MMGDSSDVRLPMPCEGRADGWEPIANPPDRDFHSMKVITSLWLTESGTPYEQRRTLRERLFTRPWRPWVTTRTEVPQIPSTNVLQLTNGTIVMHPARWEQLKSELRRADGAQES